MRHLFVLRHAKSSWGHPGQRDFDRPLNARGERDAPRMARAIAALPIRIDALVTSPAVRARATAAAVADALELTAAEERAIYDAGRDRLLGVIDGFDDAHEAVLLCGHNPGLHDLVEYFTGEWLGKFPTAALAWIELREAGSWQVHHAGCGRLRQMLTPKTLDD